VTRPARAASRRLTKKWWLGPIVVVLALLAVFILLTERSALLPAIYALF
jgi:uncharacterized protein DUF5989